MDLEFVGPDGAPEQWRFGFEGQISYLLLCQGIFQEWAANKNSAAVDAGWLPTNTSAQCKFEEHQGPQAEHQHIERQEHTRCTALLVHLALLADSVQAKVSIRQVSFKPAPDARHRVHVSIVYRKSFLLALYTSPQEAQVQLVATKAANTGS